MLEDIEMLTSKHKCYSILFKLQESGVDISDALNEVRVENKTPKIVIRELVKQDNDVTRFYLNLNNKAHKVIKNILTCEGKPVSEYIKIASSLITQGVITMEHIYQSDVAGQNEFVDCLGLRRLSEGINAYFNTGDYTDLVESVNQNKIDVQLLLDTIKEDSLT